MSKIKGPSKGKKQEKKKNALIGLVGYGGDSLINRNTTILFIFQGN